MPVQDLLVRQDKIRRKKKNYVYICKTSRARLVKNMVENAPKGTEDPTEDEAYALQLHSPWQQNALTCRLHLIRVVPATVKVATRTEAAPASVSAHQRQQPGEEVGRGG